MKIYYSYVYVQLSCLTCIQKKLMSIKFESSIQQQIQTIPNISDLIRAIPQNIFVSSYKLFQTYQLIKPKENYRKCTYKMSKLDRLSFPLFVGDCNYMLMI